MSDQQTPRDQEPNVKKTWETPRLSALDIKTTTLGGASVGQLEANKGTIDS